MLFIKNLALPLIIILAAIIRFIWLDRIPHSVNGDQLYYLLNAKALFLTGHDISRTLNPLDLLLFKYPPDQLPQAELLHFLLIPFIGPFPFSLFNSFLPNAILGIGVIYLLYLITKKLINTQTALFAAFVAAVNPWLIAVSRTAYEMIPAVFFYLLSLYILLIAKRWKILFALPFLMLAFYSYIATKLIMLPTALVFILFSWYFINKKQFSKYYALLFILLSIFVCFFILQLSLNPSASRISEITSSGTTNYGNYVDEMRKTIIATPFTSLFINKFTAFSALFIYNILAVFSPEYLFINGDYFSSLGNFGLFYLPEILFLFIGAVWLYLHRKRLFLFLSILIFISIIPEIIQHIGDFKNFTPHISLLFPFFIITIAVGIWQFTHTLLNKKLYILIAAAALIYLFNIGSFLNIYFFRMPLLDNFYNFPNLILANYISRIPDDNQKIRIYTNDPKGKFKEYIFNNNLYTLDNSGTVARTLQKKIYALDNVTFFSCGDLKNTKTDNDLIIIQSQCDLASKIKNMLVIPRLSDSGSVYKIYNDTICSKFSLNKYISGITPDDLAPGKMPDKSFCEKFIIK